MRSLLLIASALLAFGATMTFEASDANAVVCARGVYRAGCAGPNAAVVVRGPVLAVRCTTVLVGLGEALRLTRGWSIRRGLAMIRT